MGVRISSLYLPLFFLFPCFFCRFSLQQNADQGVSATSETMCVSSKRVNEHAHIFIYYPIEKPGNTLSLYLNKKNIAKLNTGCRLECRLLQEGTLTITITEGNKNRSLAPCRNSRTIAIKKGSSYYFHVNSSGALDYVMHAEKGEKSFAEAKEYIHPPGIFVETTNTGIAVLKSPEKNLWTMGNRRYIKTLLLNFSKLFR